jgi:hypothetical protein
VELARQTTALQLLRIDDASECIPLNALGALDRHRRALRERLGEAEIVIVEPWVGALLVMARDHADRTARGDERHPDSRRHPIPAGGLLVDLGVVEHRVDALASPPLEDEPVLRARPDRRGLQRDLRSLTGRGGHGHPAVGCRQCDRDETRADQLAKASGDQLQQRSELRLGDQRTRHLVQRLELTGPSGRRLVKPRVLDRNSRLPCEKAHDFLVVLGEVCAALLLRQVEVAVRDAAEEHRHSEEGLHPGVVGREADRARVVVNVVQP